MVIQMGKDHDHDGDDGVDGIGDDDDVNIGEQQKAAPPNIGFRLRFTGKYVHTKH